MEVFDKDPEKLAWTYGKGRSTVLGIVKVGEGFIEKTAVSGMSHPTEKEYKELLSKAKEMSEDGTTFVVLRRFSKGVSDGRQLPFVEFHKKELVAFCRPPWLVGQRLA